MQAFTFFVEDDRYSVASVLMVEAISPNRARELALDHMQRSPHYKGISVYAGDERLFVVGAAGEGRGTIALSEIDLARTIAPPDRSNAGAAGQPTPAGTGAADIAG
jgi:hypothetical protein